MDKRYFLGLFFLFIQVIAILRNYFIGYNYFFWYCDFVPILFSIAFFINNKNLIKGLINFGLIPQIIFLVDFIYATSTGVSPLGITLFILEVSFFSILSTIFVHLTSTFALLFTFRIKPDKKDLFYSIIFMLLVYLVTLVFTSSNGDINYVYSTGNLLKSLNFTIPFLVWLWPILTFLLILFPTHWIQYLFYKLSIKK